MEHTAVLQSSSGKKKMHAPLMNQSPGHGYWIGIGMPAGPFPWPTRACMHLTAGSVVQVQRGVLRSRATSMPRRSPAACGMCRCHHSLRDVTTSRRGSRRMCPAAGIPLLPGGRLRRRRRARAYKNIASIIQSLPSPALWRVVLSFDSPRSAILIFFLCQVSQAAAAHEAC